jgi:hypothetical protein
MSEMMVEEVREVRERSNVRNRPSIVPIHIGKMHQLTLIWMTI